MSDDTERAAASVAPGKELSSPLLVRFCWSLPPPPPPPLLTAPSQTNCRRFLPFPPFIWKVLKTRVAGRDILTPDNSLSLVYDPLPSVDYLPFGVINIFIKTVFCSFQYIYK
eukprot:NP_490703.1 Uncharacterized protein CELE_Y48G1BM.7 [Caenorhabditis elegans]